jgi:hypothetical protein
MKFIIPIAAILTSLVTSIPSAASEIRKPINPVMQEGTLCLTTETLVSTTQVTDTGAIQICQGTSERGYTYLSMRQVDEETFAALSVLFFEDGFGVHTRVNTPHTEVTCAYFLDSQRRVTEYVGEACPAIALDASPLVAELILIGHQN